MRMRFAQMATDGTAVSITCLGWIISSCFLVSSQGSIYDWVKYHRLHHQTFKTVDDPYYSEKDFLHAQVFAHIRNLSEKQEHLLKQVDMKDLEEDQIVMFQKRYDRSLSLYLPLCFFLKW